MNTQNNLTDLYLITGFLGSGKTTMLKRLLKTHEDIKIGVIVNEFGRIGIDGELAEGKNMDLIEINNGSIFCSCLENSFIKATIELLNYDLDMIFVETSGLSDPSNMDKIIKETKKLSDKQLRYNGSICIVNANNFLKVINTSQAVEKQVLFSELIIINKNDLVDKETISKAKSKIIKLNENAHIIVTTYCEFNLERLDDYFDLNDFKKQDGFQKNNKATINRPDNRPSTYTFESDKIISKEKLNIFLKEISKKVFRGKGFVQTYDGWYYVDMVGNEINYNKVNSRQEKAKLVLLSTHQNNNMKEWINNKWNQYI
ncbi:MAG: GTP-binding protein [Halanaerobiales bacterium]|nr:GTP-binding protein [Halanaerobiales bacterium]